MNGSTEVFTLVMKFLLDTLVPFRVKQPSTPWSRDSKIATARPGFIAKV